MSPADSKYFLLVSNRSTGELEIEELVEGVAAAEYGRRERLYHDRPEIEVVLVGADSLDTIKKTHSHYFRPSTESIRSDLEDSLATA